MKTIAHRGGMEKGMQNSPDGVRLAVRHQADFVELDVVGDARGGLQCAHGWGAKSHLSDCLKALGANMSLIAHLKGGLCRGRHRMLDRGDGIPHSLGEGGLRLSQDRRFAAAAEAAARGAAGALRAVPCPRIAVAAAAVAVLHGQPGGAHTLAGAGAAAAGL